jgi:hypothetical protein
MDDSDNDPPAGSGGPADCDVYIHLARKMNKTASRTLSRSSVRARASVRASVRAMMRWRVLGDGCHYLGAACCFQAHRRAFLF